MVRMINADALYGYEYLGNSGRLVITPLTDRYACWLQPIEASNILTGSDSIPKSELTFIRRNCHTMCCCKKTATFGSLWNT